MLVIPLILPGSRNDNYCENCSCDSCMKKRQVAQQPQSFVEKIILVVIMTILIVSLLFVTGILIDMVFDIGLYMWMLG